MNLNTSSGAGAGAWSILGQLPSPGRGQSESPIGGEKIKSGTLVGAAETSKELAEWRRLQLPLPRTPVLARTLELPLPKRKGTERSVQSIRS